MDWETSFYTMKGQMKEEDKIGWQVPINYIIDVWHIDLYLCSQHKFNSRNSTIFISQVYLESWTAVDPTCATYCGKKLPYMIYDGDKFCATDATEKGKWQYVDFNVFRHVTDPAGSITTVKSSCQD